MYLVLLTVGVSAISTLALILLFTLEKRRGQRFFPRARAVLDRGVQALYRFFGHLSLMLGRDMVRHTVHYLFHRLLKTLRELFRKLEYRTDQLLRVNKELAKRALRQDESSDERSEAYSRLKEVVDHKADVALTPKERRARKEKSIGTKL